MIKTYAKIPHTVLKYSQDSKQTHLFLATDAAQGQY